MGSLLIKNTKRLGGVVVPDDGVMGGYGKIDNIIETYENKLSKINKADSFVVLDKIKGLVADCKNKRVIENAIVNELSKLMDREANFVEESTPSSTDLDVISTVDASISANHTNYLVEVVFEDGIDDVEIIEPSDRHTTFSEWRAWYNSLMRSEGSDRRV